MKHLGIDRGLHLVRIEYDDEPCSVFLQRLKEVRFDIVLDEEANTEQKYRVKVTHESSHGLPIMELRDYATNKRYRKLLNPSATLGDITAISLNHAWELLLRESDEIEVEELIEE